MTAAMRMLGRADDLHDHDRQWPNAWARGDRRVLAGRPSRLDVRDQFFQIAYSSASTHLRIRATSVSGKDIET
jgi:hypothetical protein